MFGGSALVGPEIYEPPIILFNIPGFAICSVPGEPNISPAAIGWMVVKFLGCCSASNLSPSALSIKSGQHSPLDEFTATIALSGISFTASETDFIFDIHAIQF